MNQNDFVLKRFSSQKNSTLGTFGRYLSPTNFQFLAFTMEDEHRDVKVMHETRIPSGRYELKLRKYGTWYEKFKTKFPEGVFEITGVPNFTDVLIHTGNFEKDSSACVLLGNTATQNITGDGSIGESVAAYDRVYPTMLAELKKSGKIFINIFDII